MCSVDSVQFQGCVTKRSVRFEILDFPVDQHSTPGLSEIRVLVPKLLALVASHKFDKSSPGSLR